MGATRLCRKTVKELQKSRLAEFSWEAEAIEGESPVCENRDSPGGHPSNAGHVKPGVNQGGPPPKAKYSLVTDSERSKATEK